MQYLITSSVINYYKYENLLIDGKKQSPQHIEELINDKIKLEQTNDEYLKKIQTLEHDISQYSDVNLIVSNQQMNISNLTEELNHLYETLKSIENILPLNQTTDIFERIQQLMDEHRNEKEQFNHEIQLLKENLSNENEQHTKTIDILKLENAQQLTQLQQNPGLILL